MAKRVEAPVTPSVVRWARTSLGLKVEEAARRLRVTSERLSNWESGIEQPTVPKLRLMAEVYRRPLAVFFLPKPPEESRPPKDFRFAHGSSERSLSPGLRLEIRRTELRQSFVSDLLESPPANLLPSIESAAPVGDVEQLATRVRAELAVSIEEQMSWRDPQVALRQWVTRFEEKGILIFQASGIDLAEMRGMSFHSAIAPAILLNIADAPNGRIFTLAHELGHLALGSAGLCDYTEPSRPSSPAGQTEVYCNQFAAHLLIPREALSRHPLLAGGLGPREWSDEELKSLSRDFSVSREAVLRRLVSLSRASRQFYEAKRGELLKAAREYRESRAADSGGPPWHRRVVAANGKWFSRIVLGAYGEELITGSDVAEYLGTNLKHLHAIEHELAL